MVDECGNRHDGERGRVTENLEWSVDTRYLTKKV